MAKVKEIYVEASFTKNLGNYQSFKPTAGVAMTLDDKDDVKKVFEQGWELVGDQVAEQLKLFEEEQKSRVTKGLR
jgi:hypothetical protein